MSYDSSHAFSRDAVGEEDYIPDSTENSLLRKRNIEVPLTRSYRKAFSGATPESIGPREGNVEYIVSSLRNQSEDLASFALRRGLNDYEDSQRKQSIPHDYGSEIVPDENRSLLSYDINTELSSSRLPDDVSSEISRSSKRRSSRPQRRRSSTYSKYQTFGTDVESSSIAEQDEQDNLDLADYTNHHPLKSVKDLTAKRLLNEALKPIWVLPSALVGALLNVLDGLSYGMILFPVGNSVFSALGPAGLSIFYVSCIVSQLIYSLGASRFKGGVGSEMIEVVPFFHAMAFKILDRIGEDKPDSVIATCIVAFSISAVLTGLVFFLLGFAKLGNMVGFFPRQVLIGCIGGVGWFLVVTGLQVASRLPEVTLSLDVIVYLMKPAIFVKWAIPTGLAILLMVLERSFSHPLLVPAYFTGVFAIFYLAVLLIPSLSIKDLQESGWLFEAADSNEPWWYFYTLFKLNQVDYMAIVKTVPDMFALTFFGLLHVPINVPALAVSIGEDNVDVNRELIAHGLSNVVSGLFGSIQNYLVYTNSVLFIKSGGNSRLAGVILALVTSVIMMLGPALIGYIPVMVVGSLIFLLGFELLVEAVWDPLGKVRGFEYFTIVTIVITMGAWDFVYGILVGIVLACVAFVLHASQNSVIKAQYSGSVARSTVRRHFMQEKFLKAVADQIYVLKLSGYVFFGTVVTVEKTVRQLYDPASPGFSKRHMKYLIIDVSSVTDIDFSSAETFSRISRLLTSKNVNFLISGGVEDSKKLRCLIATGLLKSLSAEQYAGTATTNDRKGIISLFPTLNTALEWCENELLSKYYKHREEFSHGMMGFPLSHPAPPLPSLIGSSQSQTHHPAPPPSLEYSASPRQAYLQRAVESMAKEELQISSKWHNYKQPIPIILQTFEGITSKNKELWFTLAKYFKKEALTMGAVLYHSGEEADGFYILESGVLKTEYHMDEGYIEETILPGTTCGELPFFSETPRTATVRAQKDVVVWKLDKSGWNNMLKNEENGPQIANELLVIALKLTVERFHSVVSYIMTSS